MFTSYLVSPNLHLVKYVALAEDCAVKAEPAPVPTNHVVVIDCSGSMWDAIAKIRDQLKRKLPTLLLNVEDTITIIWFSGRGEFGTLVEAAPIATLKDLSDVYKSIDRWLKTVSLTGFKEPLEEVKTVTARIAQARPGSVFNLFFMSDGCDNQWQRNQIMEAVEAISGTFAAATFVEYGYYADRPLLTAMAEKMGGTLIFSEDFDTYAATFEAAMGKKVLGGKRVEHKLPGDVVGRVAFAIHDGDLLTFAVEGGSVKVPEHITSFAFLAPEGQDQLAKQCDRLAGVTDLSTGLIQDEEALALAYAAVSLFSCRMKPDIVLPLLKALGDVTYIEQFSNCFGKQKYSEFQDATKIAALVKGVRLTNGFDPTKVPNDDAFTVLQLLQILSRDEDNRLLLEHEKFQYSRIGRARVDSSQILTPEEQDEVSKLTEDMKNERDASAVAKIASRITEITNKPAPLKFVAASADEGYPVHALVFSEDRPNVSIRVQKTGTVDISGRCPEEYKTILPQDFSSYIYRAYSIIKDGLVNVKQLPCKISQKTVSELTFAGLPAAAIAEQRGDFVVFDLSKIPVINRRMVQETSAKALFELEWELTEASAAQKVYKYYREQYLGKKESLAFTKSYGKEATQWLADQGLTDFNGFNPKSVAAKAKDVYFGKKLNVKIKSFSDLPSINDVKKKLAAAKKMTPSEALVYKYMQDVDDVLKTDAASITEAQKRMLDKWLQDETAAAVQKCRDLMFKKSQIVFSIVVGQGWFSEFLSVDENTMDVFLGGEKRSCTVEMKEIEIEI